MATHSSTLAWKVPWTEEPGGLQSMGSLESDTTECQSLFKKPYPTPGLVPCPSFCLLILVLESQASAYSRVSHTDLCTIPQQGLIKLHAPLHTLYLIWNKAKHECTFHVLSSVQLLSHVDRLQPHGLQHARPPSPSTTPGAYSNSCPLSQWCHPAISSSVTSFSYCLQSFPASGSFPTS